MASITTVPRNLAASFLVAFVCVLIAACGGGGGGGGSPPPVSPPGTLSYVSPQVYAVGVAITPLAPTITGRCPDTPCPRHCLQGLRSMLSPD